MSIDAVADQSPRPRSDVRSADVIGFVSRHLLNGFREAAWDWSACVTDLARMEEALLLGEPPDPHALAKHKAKVEQLLELGRLIARVTEDPLFTDAKTAEMVRATLSCLQDEWTLWHGPKIPREEAERIIAACFPE